MKITHDGREIEKDAIDYGDGNVMVRYKDNGEIKVVTKKEIKQEAE
jgi:hypothetical protein